MTEISSKPDSSHIEKSEAAFSSYEEKSLSTEQESALAEFPDLLDDSRDSDIVRKVDRNVLPWLALLYAWSLIDRTNMGNAQLEGMSAELKLFVENRYSICLLVFFPTYFIVELPATLVIRRIAPRYVITFIAVTWGLCMVGMGFVKKWGGLAALRALLGVLEGGYYPICQASIFSSLTNIRCLPHLFMVQALRIAKASHLLLRLWCHCRWPRQYPFLWTRSHWTSRPIPTMVHDLFL